jgi:hypothetical protein
MMAAFEEVQTFVEVKPVHHKLLEKISTNTFIPEKHLPIVDPRSDTSLLWYHSLKYELYFYGRLERERPIGDCFFYNAKLDDEETPIIVTTTIDQHYVFS